MKVHVPTLNQFAYLLALNITNAVFQLLAILILVNHGDAEHTGMYFVAISFSVILSIFINFGTAQTAPVAIKKAETAAEKIQQFADALAVRFFPLVISILVCLITPLFSKLYSYFILLTIPLLLAEFFNPQAYLIATYSVKYYTIVNLLIKSLALAGLYFLRESIYIIEITILTSGISGFLQNFLFIKRNAFLQMPSFTQLKTKIWANALVMANGIIGQLQQSIFLIVLPNFATPVFVTCYGFVDKLLSSFKMLVNAYGNAFLPRAAGLHKEGYDKWIQNKKKQNGIITLACSLVTLIMFLFPETILSILLLGKKHDESFFYQTVSLIKTVSFVPLLIALNLLNVAEIFLEKKYTLFFKGGICLLMITVASIFALQMGIPYTLAGFYPMLVEGATLLISLFIVQQIRHAKH